MNYQAFRSRYTYDFMRDHIGEGGFGKVYKAKDTHTGRFVAIKISEVKPKFLNFTLQREVELVNKMPHNEHIIRYDACYRFTVDGFGIYDYAIMKYYEHGNLEGFLKNHTLLEDEKEGLLRGILSGIGFLHGQGVVHRDIKSQNILIDRQDGIWIPKVADFGLSREGVDGDGSISNSAIGLSYAYAAPEQFKNTHIRKNVDLWAYGVITYRVCKGVLPFRADTGLTDQQSINMSLQNKILAMQLPNDIHTISQPYQTIINSCLVLDNTQRVQTANDLLDYFNNPIPDDIDNDGTDIVVNDPTDDDITVADTITDNPTVPSYVYQTNKVDKRKVIVLVGSLVLAGTTLFFALRKDTPTTVNPVNPSARQDTNTNPSTPTSSPTKASATVSTVTHQRKPITPTQNGGKPTQLQPATTTPSTNPQDGGAQKIDSPKKPDGKAKDPSKIEDYGKNSPFDIKPEPPPPVPESPITQPQSEQIFTIVEQMPEYIGGQSNMFKFLSDNIRYPNQAREAGIEGTVYVTFVVERNGYLSNLNIKRGLSGGCNEEAIRVLSKMPPWKPGKQNGKTVRVNSILPVRFRLE